MDKNEYECLREFIINELLTLHEPDSGKKLAKGVRKKVEVITSRSSKVYPDIIIQLRKKSNCSKQISDAQVKKILHSFRKGDYNRRGIFQAKGPHFKQGAIQEPPLITDLLPTFCYLLNVLLPSDREGQVIFPLFLKEYLNSHPLPEISKTELTCPAVNNVEEKITKKLFLRE